MAKVKNQIYEGSVESYIDASGRPTYFGELYRQTITDAYPLPSLNPVHVVRISPRVARDAMKGIGSPEQAPWRECFRQCVDRWNEMPDDCPELGSFPPRTSKKNVWAAKTDQGVMCSYFDLFMAACLSTCTKISITGPTGTFLGGVISPADVLNPCPTPCEPDGLSISYTVQQMSVNQFQVLGAADPGNPECIDACGDGDFTWSIESGDGHLSSDSGREVTYTAPASNPGCLGNPVIKLDDCWGRSSTLKMAVNGGSGIASVMCALRGCPPCDLLPLGVCGSCIVYSGCDGAPQTPGHNIHCECAVGGDPNNAVTDWQTCGALNFSEGENDLRTPEQIASGCCPATLL